MKTILVRNRGASVENTDPVTGNSVWDGECDGELLVNRIRRLIGDDSGICG